MTQIWYCVQETDEAGTPLYEDWDEGSHNLEQAVNMGRQNFSHFDLLTIEVGKNESTCIRADHFDQSKDGTLRVSISGYGTANYDDLPFFSERSRESE